MVGKCREIEMRRRGPSAAELESGSWHSRRYRVGLVRDRLRSGRLH